MTRGDLVGPGTLTEVRSGEAGLVDSEVRGKAGELLTVGRPLADTCGGTCKNKFRIEQ